MLGCFCHTGSFAIHAAHYGASKVEATDISGLAIEQAQINAKLNGYADRITFSEANAFDLLKQYTQENRRYDVVILDPPAFAKNKSSVEGAYRGYKEINLRGMKLLNPGGYLMTNSCSFHMSEELFREMLTEAATDAKLRFRLVDWRSQAPDHPQIVGYPESHYLKNIILQLVD
ncbi:Ribosomal RNA large subunit methyltransferase I [bioreactor metagenome]|uniref:Ribosomal RNA large subunit methyltransferase I n=1 Tax=bioreactor metagenome TaxID=1076179 RepID=A0A645CZ05_9ZZZZ